MAMKTKDLMLDFLRSEGFRPVIEEYGITFRFEGGNFLFLNNDNDNEFFQLVYPGIHEITPQNRNAVLVAMDKTNSAVKVVKVASMRDSVWVFFEILIDSTPELGDIVPRALHMLRNGQNEFYKQLNDLITN